MGDFGVGAASDLPRIDILDATTHCRHTSAPQLTAATIPRGLLHEPVRYGMSVKSADELETILGYDTIGVVGCSSTPGRRPTTYRSTCSSTATT